MMLHPALVSLGALQVRGRFRSLLKNIKTVRGCLSAALSLLPILAWLPIVALSFLVDSSDSSVADAFRGGVLGEIIAHEPQRLLSLAMMAFFILSLIRPGNKLLPLYFSPAETGFLFPGPFTRRELLFYRLALTSLPLIPIAAVLAMVGLLFGANILMCFVGVFLSSTAIMQFGIVVSFITKRVGLRLYKSVALALALMLGVFLAAAVSHATRLGTEGFLDLARTVARSAFFAWALLPFDVLTRTILAPRILPEGLLWGSLALTMNLCFTWAIVKLDADYREDALAVTKRGLEAMRALQKGGVLTLTQTKHKKGRLRVPELPRWGGVGPLAWRQIVASLRNSKVMLVMFAIILLAGASFGFYKMRFFSSMDDHELLSGFDAILGGMFVLTIPMIVSSAFSRGFKSDLDIMERLKSLPLRAEAVVVGQAVLPMCTATALQAVVAVAAAYLSGEWRLLWLIPLGAPLNFLRISVGDFAFLLYPANPLAAYSGDVTSTMRAHTTHIVELAVMGGCLLAAVCLGAAAWLIADGSWLVALAVAWLAVVAEAAAAILCVAWAFQRFEPGVDTPA